MSWAELYAWFNFITLHKSILNRWTVTQWIHLNFDSMCIRCSQRIQNLIAFLPQWLSRKLCFVFNNVFCLEQWHLLICDWVWELHAMVEFVAQMSGSTTNTDITENYPSTWAHQIQTSSQCKTWNVVCSNMDNIRNVSVICTEKGGQDCSQCVALKSEMECGWCQLDNVCSRESQCKVRGSLLALCVLRNLQCALIYILLCMKVNSQHSLTL